MVVVDGWTNAPLMVSSKRFMAGMQRLRGWWERKIKKEPAEAASPSIHSGKPSPDGKARPTGTFVEKFDADGLIALLTGKMDFEILVWRSVSVAFLRAVIYPDWGGRFWLKILFWLEERFPRLLGRVGQYPLVVINKPTNEDQEMNSSSEV